MAGTYQIERWGIPAKSFQARSDTVYAEGGGDGYESRPTHIPCLQAANSRVNAVEPAHVCSWKQMKSLEEDDGPDEEAL